MRVYLTIIIIIIITISAIIIVIICCYVATRIVEGKDQERLVSTSIREDCLKNR